MPVTTRLPVNPLKWFINGCVKAWADNGRMGVQLRVQATITDKKSTRQLQCRARLAAATAAWQALTPAQKDAYRLLAKASHMTGFNCFVSQFSRQHPLSAY